ncbi:unnamed protein product, partial [Timema podura]|nr:unnamed protein product [Timema podura]
MVKLGSKAGQGWSGTPWNVYPKLNFWSGVTYLNASVDIMVPPHRIADFEDMLDFLQAKYVIFIENVQKLIDNEQPQTRATGQRRLDWTGYYRIQRGGCWLVIRRIPSIYAWLDELISANPGGRVQGITVGSTYEGREIRGLKITNNVNNPSIFIEA